MSMLIIAMAAALLGGATFAWFTDQKEVDATFTAGTIKLGDPGAAFSIEDIAPGWSDAWGITIENAGTLDMYYRWYFTEATDPGILGAALEVSDNGTDWEVLNNWIGSANASAPAVLAAGNPNPTASLTLYFRLPSETGNTYQGQKFNGTLVVEATQKDHQDPDAIDWTVTP